MKKRLVLDVIAQESELSINGRIYKLRFGFEALAAFEESMGFNPVVQKFVPSLVNFVALLYVGLLGKIGGITEDSKVTSSPTTLTLICARNCRLGPRLTGGYHYQMPSVTPSRSSLNKAPENALAIHGLFGGMMFT